MSEKPQYVIIDTAGRAENVKDGKDWHSILDYVFVKICGAGGSDQLPNTLLRDGKIIVPNNLHGIAWKFGDLTRKEIARAAKEVRDQFPEPNNGI